MKTIRKDLKRLNRKDTGLTHKLPIKIVQFGEGNFLRGFVDYIIDVLNSETDFNAGIAMVQPRPGGRVQKLKDQDGLYHLFMKGFRKGKEVEKSRLISCIQKGVDPYLDYQIFLDLAKEEELEFVFSNTTEAGIAFDEDDKKDVFPHYSFPAKLTDLLYERFKNFNGDSDKGLHIIPCELLNNNAGKLKEIVLKYSELWSLGSDFENWLEEYNSFYNTLVDRIVPGYPKDQIEMYRSQINFEDNSLVTSEEFLLWVIEGNEELSKRIPFERIDLNIKIVEDLQPYRIRKVRILNGAHTVMVPLSLMFGRETVRRSMNDPFTGGFIKRAVKDEIIPSMDLPADELQEFAEEVFDRFRNPFIEHQLSSIALNSISKFRVRVLPSIFEFEKKYNRLPYRLIFAFACLIRFYKVEWNGGKLPVKDNPQILKKFEDIWKLEDVRKVSQRVLRDTDLWESDLSQISELENLLADALEYIEKEGIEAGCARFLFKYK